MVEIMIGLWLGSFLLSVLVVGMNFYVTRERLQSERLKILNFNLSKIDTFWSSSLANFSSLAPGAIENDANKTLRNTLFMGFLGLGSLPGFIFLVILVLSLHILARSRKEIATFRSVLAIDKTLDRSEVETLKVELDQII